MSETPLLLSRKATASERRLSAGRQMSDSRSKPLNGLGFPVGDQTDRETRFDIKWDHSAADLRERIDRLTGWMPYDLISMSRANPNGNDGQWTLKFHYQGPKADRDRLETNFHALLSEPQHAAALRQ